MVDFPIPMMMEGKVVEAAVVEGEHGGADLEEPIHLNNDIVLDRQVKSEHAATGDPSDLNLRGNQKQHMLQDGLRKREVEEIVPKNAPY
jgi:phosphoribosylanthranilate isomerase